MRKIIFWIGVSLFLASGVAYAPLVTVYDEPEDTDTGSTNDDTSVVDLSDVDTDQPTWSPSFENETEEETEEE